MSLSNQPLVPAAPMSLVRLVDVWKPLIEDSEQTAMIRVRPSTQNLTEFFANVYRPSRINLSDKSALQMSIAIELFQQFHGKPMHLNELSAELVLAWMKSMSDAGLSAGTINTRRGHVLTLWRAAKKRNLAPDVPDSSDLPRKKSPSRLQKAWNIDEMNRILTECEKLTGYLRREHCLLRRDFWWTLVKFNYETGTRLSAMLAVRVDDIDVKTGWVNLRHDSAKTGLEQQHKLSIELVGRIKGHLTKREFVWPWSKHRNELFRGLKKILKNAGLPNDRRSLFHRIRRTTATWVAVNGGVDLASKTLGHTSSKMTLDKYIDHRIFQPMSASDVLPKLTTTRSWKCDAEESADADSGPR